MRIGIIIPDFPSYTETFFLNQVKGLCERNHQVFVFCSVINPDVDLTNTYHLSRFANLKIIELNTKTFVLTVLKNLLLYPHLFFKGWKKSQSFKKSAYTHLYRVYLEKYNCDIYHFGYSGTAISFLPVLKSLQGKTVISCLGTAENVKPITEAGRILKLYEVFQHADKIHCVCDHMAALVKKYGAVQNKIFTNRPAINVNFFTRRKPYTENKQIQIITVARLIFQKGLVHGIMAMHLLRKNFSDFKWILVGEGPELEELIFHIDYFGLNGHIILAGRKNRDEILDLYEASDIFFLPSVSEGIANVVLEAMSMEMPVICTDAGGIREVIENRCDGIICPIYDTESIAENLYQLCISFELRLKLGKNARRKIESNYSLSRYIDVFEKEYRELIKQHLS